MKHSNATEVPSPEFSRRVVVDEIPVEGETREIVAGTEEREALARRFDLLSLGALTVSLRLRPMRHGLVRVEGHLSAAVEQSCVVTREPIARHIEESFAMVYGPASFAAEAATGEVVVVADEDGPPEPIVDGAIDLGEAAAQQLALAMDQFPRLPDASVEALLAEIEGPRQGPIPPDGPFAALAALKPRR